MYPKQSLIAIILGSLLLLVVLDSNAQFTKLFDFGSLSNGAYPHSSLVSDGTFLFGTTASGGANDLGTIYKVKPDGTGFTKLLDFDGTNGKNPYGALISDGTFLYGMTYVGGAIGHGTLYKIRPDGTGFEVILDFNYALNGGFPYGSLFYDGAFLYGMTSSGGTKSYGTLFKIRTDGTGYVRLLDFDGTNTGGIPYGTVISDGTFLYGTTSAGGTSDFGALFKIKPDGTGFVKIFDFTGSSTGTIPFGSLVLEGSFLYGMALSNGFLNGGTIFKVMTDGTSFSRIFDFNNTTGNIPKSSLISDGTFLYGTTTQGGTLGFGTIFKILPTGTGFLKLADLDGTSSGPRPEGTLFLQGGTLFGARSGFSTGFLGNIYKVNTNGSAFSEIFNFGISGNNPSGGLVPDGTFLYGMTGSGGKFDDGTLFKIKPDGTGYVKLLDFNHPTSGSRPVGSLIMNGGILYGMTAQGGANDAGTIFKVNPDGTSYVKLIDFDYPTRGGNPNGSLFSDGTFLYGMTTNGGASGTNSYGVLFKVLLNGTGYTNLIDFNGTTNGYNPYGSVISDGTFLYGTTSGGGSSGGGTVFKIMLNGTGYATLHEFDYTNGYSPRESLVSDGTFLYGMTSSGGVNGFGLIFKVKTDGTGHATLLEFNGSSNGASPYGSLFSDGTNLYGTTSIGGILNKGTLFKIKPDGTGFTKTREFNDGSYPQGALISDGSFLYGMTSYGGESGMGTLFKSSVAPYTAITDFIPSEGVEGTTVFIRGTGFDPVAANNIVKFNNVPAVVTALVGDSLEVVVPVGATTGPISVTAAGTETSVTDFTVTSEVLMFNGKVRNCDVDFVGPDNIGYDPDSLTFFPVNPTDKVKVSFSSFEVDDILEVYDGPSTSSPLIASLNGDSLPADIIATGPGGELTFVFVWTDASSEWEANISCQPVSVMSYTPVQACDITFLDPGGNGNYNSGLNITQTYSPVNPADKLTVSFSSFATESCCDKLLVYDGPDTSSPLVATLSGGTLPTDITATGPGGQLTFVFISDGDEETLGWQAVIYCQGTGPEITIDSGPADFTACVGDVATFSISASGTTNLTYQWQHSTGGASPFTDIANGSGYSNVTTATLSVNTAGSFGLGRYRCRVNGDLATEVITNDEGLFINPLPSPPVAVNTGPVCGPSTVDLTVSGGTNGQYVWYTTATGGTPIGGQNNSVYTTPVLSVTTTYYASIDNGTCESTRTPVVANVPTCNPPTIEPTFSTGFIEGLVAIDLTDLIADPDNNLDLSTLQINTQPESGAPATLSGMTLTINYAGFPFISTDFVGLSVCDLTGLCTTQQISIEFAGDITIYNAVSPNGDGKNDFLFLQYIDVIPSKQQNQVKIFSRWGDEVFSINNYNNKDRVFSGNSNGGNKLPTGTYFYKISFASGETGRSGFLELRY